MTEDEHLITTADEMADAEQLATTLVRRLGRLQARVRDCGRKIGATDGDINGVLEYVGDAATHASLVLRNLICAHSASVEALSEEQAATARSGGSKGDP